MSNKELFNWIEQLAVYPSFVNSISLSEKASDERYDMELIVRFFTLRTIDLSDLRGIGDVGTFLTERIIAHSADKLDLHEEGRIFKKTFDVLDAALGDDCFRRSNVEKDRFMGGFLVSVFEVMGIGLGHSVDSWDTAESNLEAIRQIARSIWQNTAFTGHQGSGVGGASRILHTVPLGRQLFQR